MLTSFFVVLFGMTVVMTAAWATQRTVANAGWVDVFWTFGTGAACVMMALWPAADSDTTRQAFVAALGAIWSLRLSVYVGLRVARSAEDARYAKLRTDWGKAFQSRMFSLVIVQAPATALLTLSIFFAAHANGAFGARDFLGGLILAIAISGEALADEQMRRFKRTGKHGAIMDRGLWAWSRHPNYFFEWFGWLAYPVVGFAPDQPWSAITFVAPLLMFVILRFGTGVPALESTMLHSRGDAFRIYQARVSAFFPLPPRRTS